jgi:hypothetical protein
MTTRIKSETVRSHAILLLLLSNHWVLTRGRSSKMVVVRKSWMRTDGRRSRLCSRVERVGRKSVEIRDKAAAARVVLVLVPRPAAQSESTAS